MVFVIGTHWHRLPLLATPLEIGSEAARESVTSTASKVGLKYLKASDGVTRWQGRSDRQCAMSKRAKAANRDICRKRVVQVAKVVGRKIDRLEEILEFPHFICREAAACGLKVREGLIELFQAVAITSPMKRLVPDRILQGLSQHGTLNWMVIIRSERRTIDGHRGVGPGELRRRNSITTVSNCGRNGLSGRVPQIPSQ